MKRRLLMRAALFAACLLPIHPASSQNVPVVAAASDLQFALQEVADNFKKETGREVKLAIGSSGNFARQLQQGAPFEMFLSADEGYVFILADAGKTVDRGALYAEGRIVLLAPNGSTLKIDPRFDGLRDALKNNQITRFAIANPEHAPYGKAAEQALRSQGLWDVLKDKLVLGENVSQAAQFAVSGSAQGGIVAYSLVLAPAFRDKGNYAVIPSEWHAPLRQRMVLMKGASETAQEFYRYVQSPAARKVLRQYGFLLPGESS